MSNEQAKYTEDQMAQAIIDLQKIGGVKEPVERALRNAKGFAQWERDSTEAAHGVVCNRKFGTEVEDYRKAQAESPTPQT